MKKLILLGISCVMLHTVSHAQENNLVKELSFYLEGNSGTLLDKSTGQFTGNELELGMKYQQSFASAPWLTMVLRGSVLGSMNFNHINLNQLNADGGLNPKYQFNGYRNTSVSINRIEAGLMFDKYFYFGIQHDLQITMILGGEIELAPNHSLLLSSTVEVLPLFVGALINDADPNFEEKGSPSGYQLQEFSLLIGYKVDFASNWNFKTELDLRSNGRYFDVGTSAHSWVPDSLEAFTANMYIRWSNTIGYEDENGLGAWAQVRYQANNIIPSNVGVLNNAVFGRTNHDIFLRFGLSYKLDFSNN